VLNKYKKVHIKSTKCSLYFYQYQNYAGIVTWYCMKTTMSLCIHTGSVNIVRRWEAIARKAKIWNITMLTHWKIGYGHGSSVTKVTTNSAYSINSHVNIAHIIPHMSWKNKPYEGKYKKIYIFIILVLPEYTTWNHRNIGCADLLLGLGKKSLDHCRPWRSLFIPPRGCWATFIAHVSTVDHKLTGFGQSFQVAVVRAWAMLDTGSSVY